MARVHAALLQGDAQAIREALDAQLTPEDLRKNGAAWLRLAAGKGDVDAAVLLLGRGADVNEPCSLGFSALHEAAKLSSPAMCLALLTAGAAPDAPDANGQTPLHKAAMFGKTQCAFALIRAGACVLRQDVNGRTPLECARMVGSFGRQSADEIEAFCNARQAQQAIDAAMAGRGIPAP